MDWTAANADFFTVHAGFTTSEGLTIHKGVTKLFSVHAYALWLTISLPNFTVVAGPINRDTADLAPRALLPQHDRPQLPVQSAINRASSFQLARMTELCSAHQILRRQLRVEGDDNSIKQRSFTPSATGPPPWRDR
jgi:hypothetical protein